MSDRNGYKYNQYYFLYDINDALAIYKNEESVLYCHKDEEFENFEYCVENNLFPITYNEQV